MSDKFRRQLRREAQQWQSDGLIDASQYQRLAERYRFDGLETDAQGRFVMILIGLGGILLGLGVITFVAANWQMWGREVRSVLLMGLFVGVNVIGFHFWKQPAALPGRRRSLHRLGHGLLILGAIILGANMALMSQMFHQSGAAYELYLFWGLGVLGMAYSLRLTALGVLAVLLTTLGYWSVFQELRIGMPLSWLGSLMWYAPLLAGLLFVPLAYWCRSKAIFVLASLALIFSFELNLLNLLGMPNSSGVTAAVAIALPVLLLWSYNDSLPWRLFRRQPPRFTLNRPFQPSARSVALVGLSLLFYVFSFHWLWQSWNPSVLAERTSLLLGDWWLLLNVNVIVLLGVTVLQWVYLIRQGTRQRFSQQAQDFTSVVVAGMVAIAAFVSFWHLSVFPLGAIAVFTFNVLLFLLASGFMREGLAQGQRRIFWSGMILLTLQILSRLLEYNTGLLFKSLVFLLCGVGIILVGLWFERYVRNFNHTSPGSLLTEEEAS